MFCVAGLVWNQLSDVDKAPYLRAAEEEKQKYEGRMREYTAGVSSGSLIVTQGSLSLKL